MKTDLKEIYTILEKAGVSRNESKYWLDSIHLDKKKTEAVVIDLFLCVGIKHGLNREHILMLSKKLGHTKFRANHLVSRANYLKEYIVKEYAEKETALNKPK